MSERVPNVLTIAGSDPSGGAGIQTDLKTFAALGVYGCAAITALTAQNSIEISSIYPVPGEFVRRQLEAVFSDVRVDAVKIGMLGSRAVIQEVAAVLRAYRPSFIVLDPVLHASTGVRLLETDALSELRDELLPLVTLVTPNANEVSALLGIASPSTVAESGEAAGQLAARCRTMVLVTGGHLGTSSACVDVFHDGSTMQEFSVQRADAHGTHGTGCTLSSAIAALLAHGYSVPQACAAAQRFVAAAIARSADLQVGGGVGPVHQLGELWDRAARGRGIGAEEPAQ